MHQHTSPPVLRTAAALLVTLGVAVAAPAPAAPAPLRGASADSALSGREDSFVAPRFGVSTTAPSARYLHAAILDSLRHRMLMFGGETGGTSNELWALSLGGDTPAWQLASNDPAAPSRAGHVAILDPVRDRIVVFGGTNQSQQRQNDVWVFPLSQNGPWSQLAVAGTRPAARNLGCGIYDPVRDRLIVFGGYKDSDFLNDVWALSLSGTPTWTQILPSGAPPSPRRMCSGVYDPVRDRMIVMGGEGAGDTNDSWALSLGDSPQWTLLSYGGGGLPRSGHSAVYDPARDRIWLFGGYNLGWLNDVWTLSLSGTPTWAQVSPGGTLPAGRSFHSAVPDPSTDRMVVVAGWSGHALNDTWFLQLSSPAWIDIDHFRPNPQVLVPIASPAAIRLGETFSVMVSTRNSGRDSDDGRISVSFPALTDPADGQWVDGTTTGDPSAIVELPAGTSLLSSNCQSLAASCMAVEYRDSGWSDGESHDLTLTVRPPAGGTFYFYVRATMHMPGTPCTQINGLPAGGEPGFVDQQGFPVVRYAVTIIDGPQPRFTQPVSLSATRIELGQSFTLTTGVENIGVASDDGRIVVSFPGLTNPTDSAQVREASGGDAGYQEHPAGSPLPDASCQPGTATYLAVEHADAAWGTDQAYTFRVTATPLSAGTFYFYVRCAMHKPGTACQNINAVPPGGESGYTDQQGFPVTRYAVTVVDTPQPRFTQALLSPSLIELGQSFTFTTSVQNDGATSDDGRIVVSFPALTSPSDSAQVSGPPGTEYIEYPAGSLLFDASCQPLVASCLTVEYRDGHWLGFGQENHGLTLTVRPQVHGTVYFYVRSAMHKPATACEIISAVPPGGEAGYTDQQGFPVTRYAVAVTARPPTPRFSLPVYGIPSTLMLGQSFTLGASARNDGDTSDDGRIVVSFPAFTHPGDDQWVDSPSGGDAPGYAERPAGSGLLRANDCQTVVGGYLVAEYDDNSWLGGETNDLALTVTPQETGTFYVDIRATMHHWYAPGCPYVNVLPANLVPTVVDQQGWTVARFTVEVTPVPGPITTTWSRIDPPGYAPTPRFSASMAYHPGRDALVLYGGSDNPYVYLTNSWVLPLAPGSSWSELAPGGPLPRSRINQSAILNPIEDHLVIFGGSHGYALNDVTALALSPLVWWFPATPSGPQPSPRFGQSAVYDSRRHRMLVIGGYGDVFLNDVWEYPLPGNGTWTQLGPSGTPMPARTQHAAVYDPVRDRVLVFGGDGGTSRNDLWELRLGGTLTWNQLAPSGRLPDGRREHSMIYDPVRDRLVVFGGVNLGVRMNDVWALSLGDPPTWTQLYSSTGLPNPRMEHSAVYDLVRDRMIVFGGDLGSNQFSKELWALSFDAPTPTQVSFGGAEVSAERVRLTWIVPDASGLQADVERSEVTGQWARVGAASLEGGRLVFEDRAIEPGTRYGYRLVERGPGAVLDEQWVTVPSRAVLALAGASPNPAPEDLWVAFSLPDESRATLELFDLRGRRVAAREVGTLGAGEHRVALSESRQSLAAGVYLVRLIRGDRVLTAKACVVR